MHVQQEKYSAENACMYNKKYVTGCILKDVTDRSWIRSDQKHSFFA